MNCTNPNLVGIDTTFEIDGKTYKVISNAEKGVDGVRIEYWKIKSLYDNGSTIYVEKDYLDEKLIQNKGVNPHILYK